MSKGFQFKDLILLRVSIPLTSNIIKCESNLVCLSLHYVFTAKPQIVMGKESASILKYIIILISKKSCGKSFYEKVSSFAFYPKRVEDCIKVKLLHHPYFLKIEPSSNVRTSQSYPRGWNWFCTVANWITMKVSDLVKARHFFCVLDTPKIGEVNFCF